MKRFWLQIIEYFSFNKVERRGVLILLIIIFLMIMVAIFVPYIKKDKPLDFTSFDKQAEAFLNSASPATLNYQENSNSTSNEMTWFEKKQSSEKSNIKPFPFDPNLMSVADWSRLGLTTRQISTIENYKTKGGRFYSKDDFKKMYGISENEYQILEPFITIENKQKEYKNNAKTESTSTVKLDLNTANSEELQHIKGIGAYFAQQIISYRQKLGGFYSLEQLKEIPKMDSAKYVEILPSFTLNTNAIRKISINKANFDELKAHPYIGYNIALSLTNYMSKHGKFSAITDIRKSMLITDKNYYKISKYLMIE